VPELEGKLTGNAVRVPVANVSIAILNLTLLTKSSVEEINDAMRKAATKGPLQNILTINDAPLVSIDFNHNPASSAFDATQTQVTDKRMVRVLSWYDNEWGFSNRMSDTAVQMAKLK